MRRAYGIFNNIVCIYLSENHRHFIGTKSVTLYKKLVIYTKFIIAYKAEIMIIINYKVAHVNTTK